MMIMVPWIYDNDTTTFNDASCEMLPTSEDIIQAHSLFNVSRIII